MPDLPELETVNLNGVECFSSGVWNDDRYDEADLDAMVEAFDKVGFKPTVKAGHADGQENEKLARKVFGAPALGYVTKLYRQGKKLVADISKVPRRFANLIKSGAYSRVSSEIYWNYSAHDGKKYPRVLKSIAFLGADVPAIASLKEIEALYHKTEHGNLYAYDEKNREFRMYEAVVTDKSYDAGQVVTRYKDTGTFTIKPEKDGYCVYDPEGKKVKTWPTLDAAKRSLEGYNYKVIGEESDKDKGKAKAKSEEDYADRGQVWITLSEMEELCPSCASAMAAKNMKAVKLGQYGKDGSFKVYIDLPEKSKEALCERFGDPTGFRTRCMESSVGKKVDDPGAFCNALKQACHGSRQETSDARPTKDYEKGGRSMTDQELEERMKESIEKALANQAKEYERQMEYRAHKAREEAKAEAEKEQAVLREEIRRLESEKRGERIEHWLKRMKAEGKILPAEESRVRALREWIPEHVEEDLKFFTLKNGKTEEHTAKPVELFEALFEQRQSMFNNVSHKGASDDMGDESGGEELPDPGMEVDRRAKLYQSRKKREDNMEVKYVEAVGAILRQDPDLARRYNNVNRH